jgi:uncharacterized phage protein (TIGR02220 family)
MEIINFINDLRKMGSIYYKVWLPIILQFHKEENIIIKLNVPLDISKSTYYRIINYGITVFPNYVKLYSLSKNYSELILSINDEPYNEYISKMANLKKPITETIQEEPIQAELIVEKSKSPRKKSTETSYPNEIYEEIVNFLNEATGKNYKNNSAINRKFITQRLNDGFTIEDFKQVIAVKSTNWLGGKMEQFLRPETLFSNKFESYLNEKIVNNSPNSNLKNTYDQVSIATEFLNNQE